jgi:hypothetical protein
MKKITILLNLGCTEKDFLGALQRDPTQNKKIEQSFFA